MAEESGGGSWWTSWDKVFDTVKESSNNVYQLVAKDLQEFVTTIQTDTSEVIAETAHAVKEKLEVEEGADEQGGTASFVKQGVSSWLGNVSSSLKEGINKVSTASLAGPSQPHSSGALTIDRAKARVEQMQTDPGTYCNEPDGPVDLYMNWCEAFSLEDHKGEISELLVNNTKVRALYTNLVPGAVTHSLFWHRYFYKLHQFEEEDRRKAVLMARASRLEHEDLGWGDDDDDLWGSEDMKVVDIEQVLVSSAHEQSMAREAITNKWSAIQDQHENPQHTIGEQTHLRTVETSGLPTRDTGTKDELSANRMMAKQLENKSVGTSKELEMELNEKVENLKLDSPASARTRTDDVPSQDGENKQPDKNDVKEIVQEEDNVQNTREEPEKCKDTATPSEDTSNSDDSGSFIKVPLNTLQQQHSNTDVSDDGSWAKLSDEDLMKDEAMMKEMSGRGSVMSPVSSSMSSPVLVPSVDGKEEEEEDVKDEGGEDIWDEDFELDEDIPDEEVQRIVEAMKNKDPSQIGEDDDDDDDWEEWE